MSACSLSGLIFAVRFLNIKQSLPRVYCNVVAGCMGSSAFLLLIMLTSDYALTLYIALALVFLSSAFMILLGSMAQQKGNKLAKYYLIASICPIIGGLITACAIGEIINLIC